MKYFHGQDQYNYSFKQVNDRFVAEAAPLSHSGTKRYSEFHTTEPPIEFHEEETRIRYAMPSLDQQKNKGEISTKKDILFFVQVGTSCFHPRNFSIVILRYMAYIMDTNEEERVKTKNVTMLVAPTIAVSLGALTHTLGTLVPVIGASGFVTTAAVTAIGIVVGSFR